MAILTCWTRTAIELYVVHMANPKQPSKQEQPQSGPPPGVPMTESSKPVEAAEEKPVEDDAPPAKASAGKRPWDGGHYSSFRPWRE